MANGARNVRGQNPEVVCAVGRELVNCFTTTHLIVSSYEQQGGAGDLFYPGSLWTARGCWGPILARVPINSKGVLGDLFYPGSLWTARGCWGPILPRIPTNLSTSDIHTRTHPHVHITHAHIHYTNYLYGILLAGGAASLDHVTIMVTAISTSYLLVNRLIRWPLITEENPGFMAGPVTVGRFPGARAFQGPALSRGPRFPGARAFQGPALSRGPRFPGARAFQGPALFRGLCFPGLHEDGPRPLQILCDSH